MFTVTGRSVQLQKKDYFEGNVASMILRFCISLKYIDSKNIFKPKYTSSLNELTLNYF